MASKYQCRCGNVVRTNLGEGHHVHLLVDEELVNSAEADGSMQVSELLDKIVLGSKVVAFCDNCGRLALIDKYYRIKIYECITPERDE